MSWEQSWREGRTGWDAGEAAPPLVDLIASGALPKGRALVPGAGDCAPYAEAIDDAVEQ